MTRPRSAHFAGTRAAAEQHPCPLCHAAVGETCRNVHTGEPLGYQPAHAVRHLVDYVSNPPDTAPDRYIEHDDDQEMTFDAAHD